MPFQMPININPGDQGSPVTFDPSPRNVEVGDQIHWINNDSLPHWPALKKTGGSIDKTFFMPNQIAPSSSSSTYAPGKLTDPVYRIREYEVVYICSLHQGKGQPCSDADGESVEGKIVVKAY